MARTVCTTVSSHMCHVFLLSPHGSGSPEPSKLQYKGGGTYGLKLFLADLFVEYIVLAPVTSLSSKTGVILSASLESRVRQCLSVMTSFTGKCSFIRPSLPSFDVETLGCFQYPLSE